MKFNLLGIPLTGSTLDETVSTLVRWAKGPRKRSVHVFAVDSLLRAHDDPALAAVVRRSDRILTDGMPLVFLGRHVARLPITRCYGPDVMLRVFDEGRAAGLRHYLYGGSDAETLARLQSNLLARFPGAVIAGARVPPFKPISPDAPFDADDEDTLRDIESARPDIVWIGLGTPKQDFWIARFRPRLSAPVLIAVGAAFNFHAGTVRQAPAWMMRCGLEWLFRLAMEPRRLWRRYILGNPRFIALVLRQGLTRRPAPLCALTDDSEP